MKPLLKHTIYLKFDFNRRQKVKKVKNKENKIFAKKTKNVAVKREKKKAYRI